MDKEKKKTLTDRIWDLFASVKFAVVLFAMIGLTSIVGTVIEQNAEPEKNIKILTKMFGESAAPSIYDVLRKLGFMDMYHSWWFIALLLLFCANLVICSIDRLPRAWKLVKEPIRPLDRERVEKMSIRKSVILKGKTQHAKETVSTAFGKLGFRPLESAGDRNLQLYGEKGNFTRLGVYITHLSILVILAGAIIGLAFGFNAFLPLQEGETTSVAYKDRGVTVPLGFEIRCDNFEVSFYGESDMPKSYKSWLTVLKDGKEVMKKSIVVNDPLTYQGITFYQSSFGTVPESFGRGVAILKLVSVKGEAKDVNMQMGEQFTIPGTSVEGRITDFSPALTFDQSGKPYTYDRNMVNPAIYVEFSVPNEKKYAGWIFKRFPQTWKLPDGNSVEFLDYWGVEYTGMQVRKDPGVLIVYLGCIMMALGLYITFFMSHRRLWVDLAEEKGGTKVLIGATANRNRAAFERKIEKLAAELEAGHKGGK